MKKTIYYPKLKGIYFCINKSTRKIVYIGESVNILSRLASNPVWKPKQMKLRFMKKFSRIMKLFQENINVTDTKLEPGLQINF